MDIKLAEKFPKRIEKIDATFLLMKYVVLLRLGLRKSLQRKKGEDDGFQTCSRS